MFAVIAKVAAGRLVSAKKLRCRGERHVHPIPAYKGWVGVQANVGGDRPERSPRQCKVNCKHQVRKGTGVRYALAGSGTCIRSPPTDGAIKPKDKDPQYCEWLNCEG